MRADTSVATISRDGVGSTGKVRTVALSRWAKARTAERTKAKGASTLLTDGRRGAGDKASNP